MLSKKLLARQTRWLWIGFITLGPLAYLVGLSLAVKYDPHVLVSLNMDRRLATTTAARYAAVRGVDVTGWDSFCRFKPNNDLMFFYRMRAGDERDRAQRLAPEAGVSVLFRAPERSETFEVELSHKGEPLGFSRKLARFPETSDPGEAAARSIAENALRARLEAAGMAAATDLQLSNTTHEEVPLREYTWRWPFTSLPELKVASVLAVRGGMLLTDSIKTDLDSKAVWPQAATARSVKNISIFLYALLLAVMIIYGLYRFVQRARQREVSYSRAFLLGALFAAVMAAFVLVTDVALYEPSREPGFPVPDWMIFFSGSMLYAVLGLFIGLAYGAGEGDIREAYPGKLTSLDALLVGKIASRNVARALVIGCALGGWVLLGVQLAVLFWQGRPGSGEGLNELANAWIGRTPWLSPFLAWPMDVMLVAVTGLLIPLPFLHRRRRLSRWAVPLLFVLAWIACAGPYLDFRPWYGVLLMAVLRAAFLLLAFIKYDLLTAIVGLAFPTFLSFAMTLSAQPALALHRAGHTSLIVALLALLAGVFFAFRGRFYREEEVRPVYAKHLAERLSMQAEVTAAREAQLRLMSKELPATKNLSVAAACLPAFEVGGDFYDVYELGAGRLGVLIAEGGGRGLGAALSIAYAKGFLMPKILGNARADDAPAEIIRGLQEKLTKLLAGEANLEIAYAVIDAADGQLRYARTSLHPSVLIGRNADTDFFKPEEHVLKFKADHQPDGELTVFTGAQALAEGDSVIFFTEGIARDWAEQRNSGLAEFAKMLWTNNEASALQQALTKSVSASARRTRRQGLEDDLTVVIIKLEKPTAAAQ